MGVFGPGRCAEQLVVDGMDPALVARERAKAHVAMTFFLIDPI
jgi:hypothetical protein